jgi:hypothetical protein
VGLMIDLCGSEIVLAPRAVVGLDVTRCLSRPTCAIWLTARQATIESSRSTNSSQRLPSAPARIASARPIRETASPPGRA